MAGIMTHLSPLSTMSPSTRKMGRISCRYQLIDDVVWTHRDCWMTYVSLNIVFQAIDWLKRNDDKAQSITKAARKLASEVS